MTTYKISDAFLVAYQLCDRMSDGFDEIHDEK